jgi:hypothetical protein
MKDEYNPDNSIAEAELELAMGRLHLKKRRIRERSPKRFLRAK